MFFTCHFTDLGNPDDRVTHNPITKNLASTPEVQVGKLLFGVTSPINGIAWARWAA